jgi:hypothetical protein
MKEAVDIEDFILTPSHWMENPTLRLVGRAMSAIVCFALGVSTIGCGYTTRGLYPTDELRTIAVPIVKTTGLRRDWEFVVTEKLIQKIEAKTPFKVVAQDDADTELTCTLVNADKLGFGDDGFDNPRGGIIAMEVAVLWTDRRTGKVINKSKRQVSVRANEPFILELSQSNASAIHDASNRVAEQIVSLIQAPW